MCALQDSFKHWIAARLRVLQTSRLD